jgi:tetratricopeptide (TPR) repeat protein
MRTALVFVLAHDGKLDAAASEAKKILKGDERSVRAMQLLAQINYRQGKYELAKMVLENAKAIDPKDAATFNELGLVNLALKAKPAALENFKQAVALKPDFAEAKNNLGALLNESQDYDGAIKELEGAVNAAPDFAQARLNLGNAYRGRQEVSKALSQYQQVAKLKPELPDTYYNLAILHLDSELPNLGPVDRLQTAIAYFNQYRQKGGKDDRVEQYLKDAAKGIEKEQRKAERERKEQLKKPAKASDAKDKPQEQPSPTALAAKGAADESASSMRSKKKASSRKRRTVVSPNTPASNQSADAEGAPAPTRASSGKLAGEEK